MISPQYNVKSCPSFYQVMKLSQVKAESTFFLVFLRSNNILSPHPSLDLPELGMNPLRYRTLEAIKQL